MPAFQTMRLPEEPTVEAPDGSDVRVLLTLAGGSMAHFSLAAGRTSRAVAHHSVEEIWFILSGNGDMWRAFEGEEEIVELTAGVCLTIPAGTRFQFRSFGPEPLAAVAVTMPPWPGEQEAYAVEGKWPPSEP